MADQTQPEERKTGPIGERLIKLIQHYHLNKNSLSLRLNLKSNSIITRIANDPRRGMSLELIQKILFEFPEINSDWFVTGRGEMLNVKTEVKPESKPDLLIQLAQKDELIQILKDSIRSKEETISAKDKLIDNLEGRDPMGKEAASM